MVRLVRMRRTFFPFRPLSACLIVSPALLAAGCSADIARFDFPASASLSGDATTTGAIPTGTEQVRARSNLMGGESPAPYGPSARYQTPSGDAYSPSPASGDGSVRMAELDAPQPRHDPAMSSTPAAGTVPPVDARQTVSAPPPAQGEMVDVRQGDTLYALSRRHNVALSELMAVNGLQGPALKPGQKIYLPAGRNGRGPVPGSVPAETAATSVEAPADWTASYAMKPGESLYAIARRHNVKLADLQHNNGIQDVRRVKPGTVLKLPAREERSSPPAAVADSSPGPARTNDTGQPAARPTIINPSAAGPDGAAGERRVAALDQPNTASDVAATGTASGSGSVAGSSKLKWPVEGKIVTGFGPRPDGTHNDGVNLAVPMGTEVHAAETGVVAYAGDELKGYGNLILVRHDNGWVTAYAHADELMVKRGDKVRRGQVIAKAGKTGQVDQPQLHFELRQGQKPVDPTPFMDKL